MVLKLHHVTFLSHIALIGFQVSLRKSPVSDLCDGITSEVTPWWFYLQSISIVQLLLEQISAMNADNIIDNNI